MPKQAFKRKGLRVDCSIDYDLRPSNTTIIRKEKREIEWRSTFKENEEGYLPLKSQKIAFKTTYSAISLKFRSEFMCCIPTANIFFSASTILHAIK